MRSVERRALVVLALLMTGLVGVRGQPPAQPEPTQPTFRTGINFVRVDVIVTDRQGNPVMDLKQEDFEVLEDNKPQAVESFKLIKIDAASQVAGSEPARPIRSAFEEEREAARDDVRLFAIFLDDYHVRRGTSMVVREPLSRFISQQLAPADMVGIMYPLTPLSDIQLTRNHDRVTRAVQQFLGRKWDYEPRNEFEQRYAYYPTEVVERIRNQVTLSALKGLVTRLGSLREGRKAVILVSEGFTNLPPPQLRDPIAAMPGVGNPARRDPFAGENNPREDTAKFFASVDLQQEMREVYDAANRNNTAIYAVDPRGLAAGEFDIDQNVSFKVSQEYLTTSQDTLRVLAEQTDGRAIVNRNDLARAMQQIIRDSSAYYLLGYNSSQAPQDGKFHEIKVRLKRPGLQVRHRKGYWALTVAETAAAMAPPKPGPPAAVSAALSAIAEPRRGRPVRTWIGMSRGENGKTRVTFVWEATPAVPGVRREEPARVSLIASTDSDQVFRGKVPDVTLASTAPSAPSGPVTRGPARATFDSPPGKIELRITVEGANAQVLDSDARELTVPDLTAPASALSTPGVFRARTGREFQALVADPDAVPVAGREFRRAERLLIRFDVYGPGTSAPAATARLLNRAGQPMSTLTVAAGAGAMRHVDLPLAGLAPGEYLVEIKAAGEGGEATELVPIRVVS